MRVYAKSSCYVMAIFSIVVFKILGGASNRFLRTIPLAGFKYFWSILFYISIAVSSDVLI